MEDGRGKLEDLQFDSFIFVNIKTSIFGLRSPNFLL